MAPLSVINQLVSLSTAPRSPVLCLRLLLPLPGCCPCRATSKSATPAPTPVIEKLSARITLLRREPDVKLSPLRRAFPRGHAGPAVEKYRCKRAMTNGLLQGWPQKER